jgi:hypothetical protein
MKSAYREPVMSKYRPGILRLRPSPFLRLPTWIRWRSFAPRAPPLNVSAVSPGEFGLVCCLVPKREIAPIMRLTLLPRR